MSTHFLIQSEVMTLSTMHLPDIHQTGLGIMQINKESTLPVIGAAKRRPIQKGVNNIKDISEKHLRPSLNPQCQMCHFEHFDWKPPSKKTISGQTLLKRAISSQMIQLPEVHTISVGPQSQSIENPVPDRINKTPTVTLFAQKNVDREPSPRKHSAPKVDPEAGITLPRNGAIQTDEHSGSSQKKSITTLMTLNLHTLNEDLKRETDDTTSIISDLFYGELQLTVVCLNLNCNELLKTYDSISFLTLPLPSNGGKIITLEDCIHSLTEEELLGENGQWFCSFCNQLVDAKKKIGLWKLPKILIIQLKRFNYDLQSNDKIDTYVKYPLHNLDLLQVIVNPEYDSKDSKYDLIAVSNHFGNLVDGHYTAYAINNSSGQWYNFNDSQVTKIDKGQVITKNAYVLICRLQAKETDILDGT
ncbi:unnamed protein product [Didymodactylos carnosus]|uniref:ubiquitinyl hydrolase 1 n=2 Tax=Didymodactylos carnosus TaxID=1234261 RepID=A0A815VJ30_9BILA|nr:unnamed protein product [Didymodactylos carnosus]CAF4392054.1 unnamed protein product [Didymodactylos carnosus]